MKNFLGYVFMSIQAGIPCKWANDSQRFLLEHLDNIRGSPSHIYHSALPLSPSSTWLQECYGSELSQEVRVVRGLPATWGICSHTVSLGATVRGISHWNNTIAVGLDHRDIIVLDVITGGQTAVLSGHTDDVWSIVFSSDGRSLVSGGADKTVKFWDMQTGGTIRTFSGHTELVRSVSISVDSAAIASGSHDETLRLWDTKTGECHLVIKQQNWVNWVKFSPTDPQHFLSKTKDTVQQWDTNGCQVGPTFDCYHVDLSQDGTQLISHSGAIATVQTSSSGVVTAQFPVIKDDTRYWCFSPDGRIAAAGIRRIAYVWNITGPEPHIVDTFIEHSTDIMALAFSSPSSLISGSIDGSIKFWKIGAHPVGTDPKSISLTQVTIMSITLQAEHNIYITSDSDGVVKTWDIFTGICKTSFQTPAKGANRRDIQQVNGRLVVAWEVGDKIKIWDVEKEELLLTVDGLSELQDIRISEDGSRVYSLNVRTVQAQSIQTGEIVGRAGIRFIEYCSPSLNVHGSRVWIHYSNAETQVWDFETLDSAPTELPNMPLKIPHPDGDMLWDTGLSCIKMEATKRVVFWLSKQHGKPIGVQWNNQFLFASFISGEVLVLDLSNVVPQ